MGKTTISWTDVTDNIIVVEDGGWWCRKISEGCTNCYAASLNDNEFYGGNHLPYSGPVPKLKLREDLLDGWARQKKPKRHFVASMTDVFGEWVLMEWSMKFLRAMWRARLQTFQLLTKRPEVMADHVANWLDHEGIQAVPPNIWLGVSVENQKRADERIPILLKIPAAVRFLSVEPMLEAIDLSRWIGHYPFHENRPSNGEPSRSGGDRRDSESRFGRQDMDVHETRLGSVEEAGGKSTLHSKEGRKRSRERLPTGPCNDKQGESLRLCAPDCLPGSQRNNPTGSDDQSQRRQQEPESPEQFNSRDLFAADPAREGSSREKIQAAVRREKRHGEAEQFSGNGNPEEAKVRGKAEIDSDRLCDDRQECFKDSIRPSLEIHLVIIGGESGPKARACDVDWIRSVVSQCKASEVPMFVKQLGSYCITDEATPDGWPAGTEFERGCCVPQALVNLRHSKGGDPAEWPEDLRIREFPQTPGH